MRASSLELGRLVLKVHGMHCAEEVAALRRELGPYAAASDAIICDLLAGKLTITLASTASRAEVLEAIARTGMRAEDWHEELSTTRHHFWHRQGQRILTAVSGLCLLVGFLLQLRHGGGFADSFASLDLTATHDLPNAARIAYGLAILTGGWFIFPKAFAAARRLRPDMNLLMTLAVVGAVGIGEWFEAATVAFLFAVSLALESWSVGRARRAVAALMNLAPPLARIECDGNEQQVPPDQVSIGTRFVVKPGERIPLDGRVVEGSSDVNQAPITGESIPVPKNTEDVVFAGTINGDGALVVECTRQAVDTTLAKIIRMVGEAQARRAPSERWVENFARIYTPAVMALALIVLVLPPLWMGGGWAEWLYRSLVLLVIACPCALVISTPVSIVAGLAAAARNGVLVKGGEHMETPSRLRTIAFDKTGTLTHGKPSVVKVIPWSGHDERELLARAAALEARADHPLAQAIVSFADHQGVPTTPADELQILQGKGARGRWNGRPYWVGSHRYLQERGQETGPVQQRLEALVETGHTVVVVGNESHVCGFVALSDTVRPVSRRCMDELRQAGIEHIVMLTGDSRGTAEAIARETGIDEVQAELLPEDKVAVVESLATRYGNVAMVGDGVNDAPAMARANVGIAMAAAGSDAAIETADIALMSDDLSKLPWLIRHSRRTVAVIRQNIAFALAVKLAFVGLTFAGHASLWAAIAADMGASFLVIFNGLRLLRASPIERTRIGTAGSADPAEASRRPGRGTNPSASDLT